MNSYLNDINSLCTAINSDKTLNPKHRNKLLSRLDDVRAYLYLVQVEMGQLAPPVYMPDQTNGVTNCICPEGAIDRTCPVHGSNKA